VIAIIDFSPLWDTMKEKQVSQYQLLKQGIDNKTLDSLKKNRNITLNTLEKLCQILDCEDLNKIVKFID
jgi:DNA-binding Xre family transcriptional regulator